MTGARPDAAASRVAELVGVLEGADRVIVLTHDNPDPDAIASAAGLAFLIEALADVPVSPAFGGIVGRAENRALLEELDAGFERPDSVDAAPGTLIALVDTQPRAGNNALPEGRIASVVVDHHPPRTELSATGFADVRPEIGACATIIVEYLRAAGLEPDRRLATSLFYGIQSETLDLGREVSEADIEASVYLYPRTDPAAISRIRHARVPPDFFRSIHDGLERAWRSDGVICIPAGRLPYPDMVAQLADLFMRVKGVDWVIASGRFHDDLLFSLRTYDVSAHAGELVQKVLAGRGPAGGHGTMAGARVDVRHLGDDDYEELVRSLFVDFCAALGVSEEPREPLIRTRDEEGQA
ncbi:MAG: bifunctional oligoribonuclease/PAP phosphatase NrnA [Gemmatimonadota bacterium]